MARLRDARSLRLAGVTTHFANIEDSTNHEFAESQIAAFTRIADAIAAIHPVPFLRHNACSAAVLLFNRTHLDLARVGISLYGLWPSKETYVSCLERGKPSLDLKPVMTWKTRIAQVKQVAEGGYVGYGCAWRATRPTKIAVLPVGYYEGYDRELSGLAHVLVRGKRAPVRGRVCMNMCMVDVTDIPGTELEDEVVLLGRQGDERVTAEQIAVWRGTIAYEIISRIHPSLPRVVV
jgi:alanine racemase